MSRHNPESFVSFRYYDMIIIISFGDMSRHNLESFVSSRYYDVIIITSFRGLNVVQYQHAAPSLPVHSVLSLPRLLNIVEQTCCVL